MAVLLVCALLAAPASLAQSSTDERPEAMALTDQAPPSFSPPSGAAPCNDIAVHGLAEPGQAPEQDGQASTSSSTAAFGCTTLFRAETPGAFNLTQDATLELYVGCEQPTVLHQPLNNVRVWLVREGQALSEGAVNLGPTCSPGSPLEMEVDLPQPDDPLFNASTMFGVNVTVFGSPNMALDNLFVHVGGQDTASTLHLPGLAEAFQTPEEDESSEDNETEPANETGIDPQSTDGEEDSDAIPAAGVGLTVAALAGLAIAGRRRQWT